MERYSIYAEIGGKKILEDYNTPIEAYSRYTQLVFRLRKKSKDDVEETLKENYDKVATSSHGFVYCEQYDETLY